MPGEKGNSSNVKTIYVTDLAEGVQENELVAVCRTYGKIQNIWVAPASPRFAIVEFEKAEDAADIVYDLHGEVFCGRKLSVQLYKRQMAPQRPRSPPSKSPEAKRLKRSKRDRRTPMQYRKKRRPISPSDSAKSSSSEELSKSPVKSTRSIDTKRRSPSYTERSSSRCRSPSRSIPYEKAAARKRPRSRSRPFADCSPEPNRYERRRKSPKTEYSGSRRTSQTREYSKRRSPEDFPRRRPPSPARRYDKRPPSPPPQRPERRSPDSYEPRRMTKRSESPPRRNNYRVREEVYSPVPRYSGAPVGRGGPRYTNYQDQPFSKRGRPPSPSPTSSGRGQYYSRNKNYQEPYQRSGQSFRGSYTPRGPYRDRREIANDNDSKQTDFNKDRRKGGDDWDVQEAAKLLATTICNEEDWDLEDEKEPSNSKPKHVNAVDDWGSPPKSNVKPTSNKHFAVDDGENWDTIDVHTKETCISKDKHKHNVNDDDFYTEKSSNAKPQVNSGTPDWTCSSEKRKQKSEVRGTTPGDGDWDSPEATPTQVIRVPERKRSVEAMSGSWSSKPNTAASRGEDLEDVSDEDELDIQSSNQKTSGEYSKTPRSPSQEEWTNMGGSKSESRQIRGLTPDDGGWDDDAPKISDSKKSTRATTVCEPKSEKQKQFRSREASWDSKPQFSERNYDSHSGNHRDEIILKKSRATKPTYDDRQDDWKIEQKISKDVGRSNKHRGVTPDGGDWD